MKQYSPVIIGKVSIIAVILTILLAIAACTAKRSSDEEKILEIYAQMSRTFSREDLRGVMKDISKEFQSEMENQKNYEEVQKYRKTFILNNSNVSIDFRNISISVSKSKAAVKLTVSMNTDQITENWVEIDSLEKKHGSWKIVSWKLPAK